MYEVNLSAYDAYRGREAVEEAARQLVSRRDAILSDWDAFRRATQELTLPETPIPIDRIGLIAVTNIPHFTSQMIGDVVVTDDWCLGRFFDDPAVELQTGRDVVGVLGYLRPAGSPTPQMLLEYLVAPSQVQVVEAGLTEVLRRLPSVDDQPPIAVTRTAYHPPLVDLALQRLRKQLPPPVEL